RQLYQLDNAGISTIHAFCKTLIQRWFPQAGVDPQATVLAGDEAELLKRETLDRLFVDLYGRDDDAGNAFRNLVDEYGGGQDWQVAGTVLRVHRFIHSLADPQGRLEQAVSQADPTCPDGLAARMHQYQHHRIERELIGQIQYGWELAATIRRCWPAAKVRAEYLDEHVARLKQWQTMLKDQPPESWVSTAETIRAFELPRPPRKPSRLNEEDGAAYDKAKQLQDEGRDLFKERLLEGVCAFTADEYREGLAIIAPHVRALADLVTEFDRRYADAKRSQRAVDFDGLQRLAYQLLTSESDRSRPSEVARQLQKQYRYVLVDEFQDVDPLQAAILHCVSRESADPPQGNLFSVGDIKQSIYRFRLAEPDVFAERERRFDAGGPLGEVIRLQENFRSRREVITAINLVFQPLMRQSFGGTDYDERAALRAAATYPRQADGPMFGSPAVEILLLEPITAQTARVSEGADESGEEESEPGGATQSDRDNSEELEAIEREAFLIGSRIRRWMGLEPGVARMYVGDRPRTPGGPPTARPIEYRDIVILLRSLPHKAEPLAEVLRRMGVPARIERDAGSIDSTEFRDVLSLLQVLDNPRQDIPLAAVLRSPLLGDRFDENDLMCVRLIDRQVLFHEAVERYATGGDDSNLRERLRRVHIRLA
ncbi:MAG TPA: UvrD-helicase domain-containing protein, partial [Phycisphaerae bacterium]|nr:UvrD-helicase domain-containing protein [Phycisphaerae bacterium]